MISSHPERQRGICFAWLFLACALLAFARAAHAQESVSVEMESPSLTRVADDFDEGRHVMYCMFGRIKPVAPAGAHRLGCTGD